MSKCLPCSRIKSDEKSFIKRLKNQYDKGLTSHYVFRLKTNGGIHVVNSNSFTAVFNEKIKPNFKHGSEYFHISEFKF